MSPRQVIYSRVWDYSAMVEQQAFNLEVESSSLSSPTKYIEGDMKENKNASKYSNHFRYFDFNSVCHNLYFCLVFINSTFY